MPIGSSIPVNPIIIFLIIVFLMLVTLIISVIKRNRTLAIISTVLISLALILTVGVLFVFSPEDVDKESMIKTYIKNREKFNMISQFIVKYGDGAKIVFANNTYKVGYFSDNFDYSNAKIIENEEVMNGIKYVLNKLKFKFIFYSGGEVIFTRTSNHMGEQQRIVNVINKDSYNQNGTEILHIEDNWFYFEGR